MIDTALPTNLNAFFQLGSILAALFVTQLASGVFLAMFYTSSIDLAFASVDYVMRDVSAGWALRYLHANGASLIFTCLYIHVMRGCDSYAGIASVMLTSWSLVFAVLVTLSGVVISASRLDLRAVATA